MSGYMSAPRPRVHASASHTATIPVLFTCDAGYLHHTAACIASLTRNNPDLHFTILIASVAAFGDLQDKFIRSFQETKNATITFRVFNFTSSVTLPLSLHYTAEVYIRLWIGELFPEYDRAIYLDPDLIVLGNVMDLWKTDLGDSVLGAVPTPGSTRPKILGLPEGSLYFNSGVILFDLDRWRRMQCKERCLEHIQNHPEMIFEADQDVLNFCLASEWLPLPYKWNVINPFYFLSYDLQMTAEEIDQIRRDAKIIHFNGHSKPWNYLCNHPRRDEYWKYIRLTEWRDLPLADHTFMNIVKNLVGRAVPPPLKRALRTFGVLSKL